MLVVDVYIYHTTFVALVLRVDPLDIPTTVHESEFCNYNTTGTFCAVTIGKLDIDVAISFHTLDATAVGEWGGGGGREGVRMGNGARKGGGIKWRVGVGGVVSR